MRGYYWVAAVLLPMLCSCAQEVGRFYQDLQYGLSGMDAEKGYTDAVVYYATNRERLKDGSYSGEPGAGLRCGTATVRIDKTSPIGGTNAFVAPFKKEWVERDGKVVAGPAECDLKSLLAAIREARGAENRPILIYVHGFNVSCDDAIRSAGKLAADLGNRVVPVLYSWPSEGKIDGYLGDENNVYLSGAVLGNDFLKALRDETATWTPAAEIHLLAHSLGSRVTLYGLEQLDNKPFLATLTFAAPDVDGLEFCREAPRILDEGIARRLTLYVAERDLALAVSQRLHGRHLSGEGNRARAGQGGALLSVMMHANLEIVDATLTDVSPTFHSYIQTNRAVLADLYGSVVLGEPASERNLYVAQTALGERFWLIRP